MGAGLAALVAGEGILAEVIPMGRNSLGYREPQVITIVMTREKVDYPSRPWVFA